MKFAYYMIDLIPMFLLLILNNPNSKSSYQMGSLKKGVLRNFAKFTRKQLCQGLIFNKVAGLMPATLLKKRPWHRCFSVNFVKFLRTPFCIEHL